MGKLINLQEWYILQFMALRQVETINNFSTSPVIAGSKKGEAVFGFNNKQSANSC